MSEQIEKPKDDASYEQVSPAGAACVAGIVGLAIGTLAGGPALGIAFAAIWGIQAAVALASENNSDAHTTLSDAPKRAQRSRSSRDGRARPANSERLSRKGKRSLQPNSGDRSK